MDRKDAMKAVAKDRGVGRREIYQYMLDKYGNSLYSLLVQGKKTAALKPDERGFIID